MATAKKTSAKKGGRTTPKGTTPANKWKGKGPSKFELDLPSGNICLVRRVSLEQFLRRGMIPNSLLGIVEGALKEARGGKSVEKGDEDMMMSMISEDPQKLNDMFGLMDQVVLDVVIEPKVLPVPEPDGDGEEPDRDEDALYVDDVDMEDKMYIFTYVTGGAADVERFRSETAERLAHSQDGGEDAVPTE